jgi:light-regulated signal transduction histidine kinase (bacteriophytochrome)
VEIEPGLVAAADPALMGRVMANLVGNAWKFTSKKSPATISVGAQPQEDGETAYYVRDNGAGFDMAFADRLFNAFQRLHSPTEFPGTGIGLATVQRIITRHNGRIWAQSAPDAGATFYFTLPPAAPGPGDAPDH